MNIFLAVVLGVLLVNVFLQWALLLAVVRAVYGTRLDFQWRTTFFGQTRYGLDLYLWDRPREEVPNSARVVWGFRWRDERSIPDFPYNKGAKKWALPVIPGRRREVESAIDA